MKCAFQSRPKNNYRVLLEAEYWNAHSSDNFQHIICPKLQSKTKNLSFFVTYAEARKVSLANTQFMIYACANGTFHELF